MVTAAQLVGKVSIEGADQSKAILLGMADNSKKAQEQLNQLQNAAKDASSILSNRFISELKNAQGGLQDLSRKSQAAGLDVSKLSQLQQKASETAAKLGLAQAQAAAAQEKANAVTNDASASAEKIALAQARAAVAAQNVAKAELSAGDAMSMVQGEATRLADAIGASQVKSNLFTSILGSMHERTGGLIAGFKGAVGSILEFGSKLGQTAFGIQSLWQTVTGLGHALVDSNASMEQTQVAFTQLLGSSKAAGDYLKQLQDFAASTPFEFPELAQDAQQMMAFGFSAQDVIPMLTDIGDAMGAMGKGKEQVAQIVTVFGQMHAAGKLNAQDMMQLTSTGIPAWRILADSMGLSVAQVQKMTTDGLIPADDAISRLRAGMHEAFGGGMQAQSKTFAGILSTVQDNISAGWRAFTGPLFERAKDNLIHIGDLVSSPVFQQFAVDMGQRVGDALQSIGTFVNTNVIPALKKLAPIVQDIGQWFILSFQHAQPLLKQVGDVLGGIFNGIVDFVSSDQFSNLVTDFESLGNHILRLDISSLENIGSLLNPVLDALGSILKDTVVPALDTFVFDLSQMYLWLYDNSLPAQIVKDALVGIGVAIAAIQIGQFVATIPGLIAKLGLWAAAQWAVAVPAMATALPYIAIGALIAVVVAGIILAIQHWGEISKWLQDRWKDVSAFFGGIWKNIQGFFGGVGQWFHDRWNEAAKGTMNAFGAVGQWFHDRWTDIQNVFGGIGQWFHDRWNEAWNAVTGFFGPVGKWFGDRWNEVMDTTKPFRDYMGAVFETIWNILVALWGKLGAWFHDRWQEAYNKIVEVFGPVGQWFQDRWKYIQSVFGAVGNWFHDRWTEAYNATILAFGTVGKWFGDRWIDVQNIFKSVGAWFHDRFSEAWNATAAAFGIIGHWFGDRWVEVQNIFKSVGAWFHDRWQEAWNGIVTLFAPIGKWFGDRWNEVMGGVNTFTKSVSDKFNEIKTGASNIFRGMVNGIIDQLNNGIGAVESFVNFFGKALDDIAKGLGTKGTIPMIHLGRIPHYAEGTQGHPGGPAIVGEKGPELVFLPKGASVVPNDLTKLLLPLQGKIPGYAGGIGDIAGSIMSWIGDGARGILDHAISALHISAPSLPGMSNIASAMFNKVKDWAVGWIDKLLPKFDFGGSSVPGNLQQWIAAGMALAHAPGSWAGALAQIAMHESGGNPRSINTWDINAQNGDPSRGLFQTIGATFRAYALPGHLDIYNPVDNTAAAIGYIRSRYGDVFHVPGIMALAAGKPYVGYANGGIIQEPIAGVGLNTGTRYAFGERGKELVTPYVPSGVNLAQQLQPVVNITINVQPNDLNIDGRRLARALEPHRVELIRQATGVKI